MSGIVLAHAAAKIYNHGHGLQRKRQRIARLFPLGYAFFTSTNSPSLGRR